MEDLANWWENTNKEIAKGTDSFLKETGKILKGTGDVLMGAGEKANEASRFVTGGTMMDPVRERYDLGFISIQTTPKSADARSRGPQWSADSNSSEKEGGVAGSRDERKGFPKLAIRETDSSDDSCHVGFVKIVRKKEKKVPHARFSDGWEKKKTAGHHSDPDKFSSSYRR